MQVSVTKLRFMISLFKNITNSLRVKKQKVDIPTKIEVAQLL